jgi:hypothetical protein
VTKDEGDLISAAASCTTAPASAASPAT